MMAASGGVATAAKAPSLTDPRVGNDVSWPQCGRTLPTGQAFGIVGVNGGLATTTNECLATQLTWAYKSSGSSSQPKAQLYVNTANPGGLNTPSWPKNNTDPAGTPTSNPYDTCDGSDSLACAWQYGWNRALEDVRDRFAPAARTAVVNADPAGYTWWLDVETENTWKTGIDGQTSNRADMEGMLAYFKSVNATVGLYSTTYQWGQIAGTVPVGSSLNGLASWHAGARNLSDAKSKCTLRPLTAGGKTVLVQYIANNFDHNYSCV